MTGHLASDGVGHVDGRLILEGAAAGVRAWIDGRLRAMALERGAVECHFPSSIDAGTLRRAGYFEAFPGGAAAIGAAGDGRFFLSPAVCYHAYAGLAGRRLREPVLLTAAQTCFREADRHAADAGRLWEFTMREVIFIGPDDWVAAERREWTAAAEALARAVRLDCAIEPAADPFFGGGARGRRLMQQLKGLKDELRVPLGPERIAAASFNSHEAFFGARFGITLENGRSAHSGCAAFGLERWALALLARHGGRTLDVIDGTPRR